MVQVPIIHDSLIERTEQFHGNLALVEDNGISVTVDPALATVNIIDNDSELGMYIYFVPSFVTAPVLCL